MPRQARLDAPGTLHHVMIRGIERSPIFEDDQDRNNFVSREKLGTLRRLINSTDGAPIERLLIKGEGSIFG